jgi:hypothetical protein
MERGYRSQQQNRELHVISASHHTPRIPASSPHARKVGNSFGRRLERSSYRGTTKLGLTIVDIVRPAIGVKLSLATRPSILAKESGVT